MSSTDVTGPQARPGEAGCRRHRASLLWHTRPVDVPERTLRLSLTWGLGGAATLLLLVLFVTGLLLKFAFEPVPDRAYDSILYLQTQLPFGRLVRNLHRWSGNLLLLAAFLHLLRVFYTGAIDRPRRSNWVIGLGLFGLAILANFTGYLLPWDQIAYWAVTISSSMLEYLPLAGGVLKAWVLGGSEPGAGTLISFYALHTAVLPALLLLLLPFHIWRIRRAQGLVVPRSPDEALGSGLERVPASPHLFVREVAFGLALLAALLLYAMMVDAPLAGPANPGLSPNPTKAPWYFMGLQELLLHFHPLFSVFVIPALLSAALLLLPWMDPGEGRAGVWFRSRTGRRTALLSAVVAVVATVVAVVVDEALRTNGAGGSPGLVGRGLLPLAVVTVLCSGYVLLLKVAFRATRTESLQSFFTLVTAAFVVLTLIGVWFRGAGMQLGWTG
jgi:quinol-cytochrome oxidoreductase complex cytochrome b subunit